MRHLNAHLPDVVNEKAITDPEMKREVTIVKMKPILRRFCVLLFRCGRFIRRQYRIDPAAINMAIERTKDFLREITTISYARNVLISHIQTLLHIFNPLPPSTRAESYMWK